MPLSMRSLLTFGTLLPESVRADIMSGAPESARHLMTLGVSPCEAAELLDEPCSEVPSGMTGGPVRRR
jgi:hypothetical protein